MTEKKIYFYLFILPLLVGILLLSSSEITKANTAGTNIVISQIQVAGEGSGNADQEYIELYNPTNENITMDGWRLTRKSSGGSQSTLVSNMSGIIPAHGYFLIAHPSYSNPTIITDLPYSATSSGLANNNTVLLYSDAGQTVVDKVGFGTVTLADFETQAFGANPTTGQTIIRKASQNSTPASIIANEATLGNGYDTDNNANDFLLLESSSPRNTSSPIATAPTQTGTPTPTLSLTPTVTPTNEPTPTTTPTVTTTPTQTPTITNTPTTAPTTTVTPIATVMPTNSASPTPTTKPTKTPTPTVKPTTTVVPTISTSPTTTMTPSPTKAPTITPTKKPHHGHHNEHKHHENKHHENKHRFHFEKKHKKFKAFGKHYSIPYIHCSFR